MREAPARELMEALWAAGAKVQAYDPVAMGEARRIYGERDDLALVESAEAALEGADALAIVTEWQEFRSPDFDAIRDALRAHGHLRRPQPLRPGAGEELRAQVFRHRAGRAAGRLKRAVRDQRFAVSAEPSAIRRCSAVMTAFSRRPTSSHRASTGATSAWGA